MIQPVKQASVQFTVDGTSTAFSFDLSLPPIGLDLAGALPTAILALTVTSSLGVAQGVTGVLAGTTVTLTFASAPVPTDSSANLVIYTAAFFVQYP